MNPCLSDHVSSKNIQIRIINIRGQNIIVDSDLAELYGVSTKRLNEQVKRNARRFPVDFVFQGVQKEVLEDIAIGQEQQRSEENSKNSQFYFHADSRMKHDISPEMECQSNGFFLLPQKGIKSRRAG